MDNLDWCIGLIEGDGCIRIAEDICKRKISEGIKTYRYLRPEFKVTQKDKEVIRFVIDELSLESSSQIRNLSKYGRSGWDFSDQKRSDVLRIFSKLNDRFYLNKSLMHLKEWRDVLDINEAVSKNRKTMNKSWITGFVEAEGSLCITKEIDRRWKRNYTYERPTFQVGQDIMDREVIDRLVVELPVEGGGTYLREHKEYDQTMYFYKTNKRSDIVNLTEYFDEEFKSKNKIHQLKTWKKYL